MGNQLEEQPLETKNRQNKNNKVKAGNPLYKYARGKRDLQLRKGEWEREGGGEGRRGERRRSDYRKIY